MKSKSICVRYGLICHMWHTLNELADVLAKAATDRQLVDVAIKNHATARPNKIFMT